MFPQIRRGEVRTLLGENGAGKSTLVNDLWPGKTRQWINDLSGPTVHASIAKCRTRTGVAMVFRIFRYLMHYQLQKILHEHGRCPKITGSGQEHSTGFNVAPLEPNRIVGTLSAGERQRVEIIRCLLQNPKLLIMMNPHPF